MTRSTNGSNWLEQLESRLDAQLQSFLRSNPQQEALLAEQDARERQQRLMKQRLDLRQEAEMQRQGLLRLAGEIRQWEERVSRARSAGADELASRAEDHVKELMEQGRNRWQTLGELGQRFTAVEQELTEITGQPAPPAPPSAQGDADSSLDADWAAFESQQELQELRRKMQR
ncbi:MAG: hercynine metabolism protein [Cyanobacteriota bacterium]|jgi:hercynine metabolism protein